ncbi:putative ubiquitin-conjugating enzyme E2 23 [Dichanthelium oligosanthes]|uniref:Putative ubiquitin-conjugating enzyme E2 23 n=1 Tax=Dichanthelium oligosanthes TaxID=888268 RepID=A0A1E5WGC1_9POAL|nr:putative ubiquitin-conjugating enzyme E2 23 [Dichanthelium oligosanthes]
MENLPNGSANIAENNQENEKSMDASEPEEVPDVFVYREDVVSLKSKEDVRGLVLEVAGEYDSEGSITDDDDTDTEEHEHKAARGAENGGADGDNASNGAEVDSQSSLPDNKVRVLWIDGSEKTEDIDDVVVVDRSFLHGDLVASASDPTGQMGLVVDVNLVVDLQGANGDMIKGVSSKDLRRIREFNVGDYVVSGPWLGRVDEVLDNVNVLFDDGSVCKVNRADPMRLKPVSSPIHPDTACPFYPGQRVKAVSSSVFKTSRWLNGLWKASRLEGTVTKVESVAVTVYWIASARFAEQQSPPEEQNPKDLTLLSCFSYANWQLTDWCLPYRYTSCADDAVTENSEAKELHSDDHTGNKFTCSEISALLSNIPESQADCETEQDQRTDTDANHRQTDVDSSADVLSMSDGDNSCVAKESEPGTSVSAIPKESSQDYRKKFRKVFLKKDKRTKRRDESFERALLIANTYTKVDVIWQDGTKECGVTSTLLIPIHSPNDHEFFPEQYVIDKVTNDVDDSSEPKRVGLVRSVNAKDRTASVSWFKPSLHPEEPKEIECNEIVSAYELDGHPDYDYCYGDVVVRLPSVSPLIESTNSEDKMELDKKVDPSERLAASNVEPPDASADDQFPQKESSSQFTSLSWAGNIVGFQDGEIEVIWGDGSTSKVGPHEIYVVGREDDGASLDDGTASDGASWETVDDNEMDLLDDSAKDASQNVPENNIERENGSFSSQDGSSVATGPLSVAFGFMTRLASDLFARGRRHLDGSNSDAMDEVESHQSNDVSETGDDIDKIMENHVDTPEHTAVTTNDSSAEKSVDVIMADNPADSECFKHFDVLQCPPDHHYLENTAQGTGGRKWVKKVQQEWSILEKNLPDYIYVRVFEDRMDLIRAVIIGASGTPYQDGLFFFDFHLPPEYPQVPPHFEDFVKSHFQKRGHYILKACEAYLQGNVVGTLTDDACTTDRSKEHSSSVGFKLALAKILPRLITALKETGADCDQYEHLGKTETVQES